LYSHEVYDRCEHILEIKDDVKLSLLGPTYKWGWDIETYMEEIECECANYNLDIRFTESG
jgi:hypothetical protein